ncbi:MAG: RsmD family RNA methyltransferase [Pseudomonadota bacterium]|nr:RsmD family RNA methyltransferase [Pseudomonadota bacterium]
MKISLNTGQNLFADGWSDYELLDSGDGQKLERFGPYLFIRPEPQALWSPYLDKAVWQSASGRFAASDEERGKWELDKHLPASWSLGFDGVRFLAKPPPVSDFGFLPEQSPHWLWTAEQIGQFKTAYNRPPRLLNLFAYSGVASLHAARAGAEVTHLDASKKAVAQAFQNRDLSGLADAPIRFITDDASAFVLRELRRDRSYDAILLDPPKYGRGPKGEIWQLNDALPELLANCARLLSDTPLCMIATIYAIRTSTLAVQSAMADALQGQAGTMISGEVGIRENRTNGRAIGQALYVRWSADIA